MARIRGDGTILLNALQMATYKELLEKAVDGVIHRDVAATYKQNVIGSLVKHGVIKQFRTIHYAFVKGAVIIDQPEETAESEALAA